MSKLRLTKNRISMLRDASTIWRYSNETDWFVGSGRHIRKVTAEVRKLQSVGLLEDGPRGHLITRCQRTVPGNKLMLAHAVEQIRPVGGVL